MQCHRLRCVITGAGGFVGRALTPLLAAQGYQVVPWSRAEGGFDLDAPAPDLWAERLVATDVVIHLAARVHNLRKHPGGGDDEAYERTNHQGTVALAHAARAAGVKKFIFLSTAKVFGEGSAVPYRANSVPDPQDAYGRSKLAAEQALMRLATPGGMEVVVIRPPLVYGPGVRANFLWLQRLAALPLPLPLASLNNRRAMISVHNLADLIALCVLYPAGSGVVFLCSDDRPYTLPELVTELRAAQGRRPGLFAVPQKLLLGVVRLLLGDGAVARLFGNFELDTAATRQRLNWAPRHTLATTMAAADGGPGKTGSC